MERGSTDPSELTDDILSEFQHRLELVQARSSVMTADPGSSAEFLRRMRPVLREVLERTLGRLAASREDERRWIARELHDRAANGMAVTLQWLDQHRRLVHVDADRSERLFDAAIASLQESIRTVQEVSTGLRRVQPEDRGVAVALAAYLRDNVPGGIHADLMVSGAPEAVPRPVSGELYLIVREACRNALRHADPANLLVRIAITGPAVTAVINDDGGGFDVGRAARGPGGGLPSMTERAGLLGGCVAVDSVIGQGTTVTIRIPLPGDGGS